MRAGPIARHALSHEAMPFRALQLPPRVDEPPGVASRAAVAISIGPDDRMLFIKRAERDGDPWSGHMAFPGGRAQADDPSPVATAIREAREEVGLDLSGATFVGALPVQMNPVRDPSPNFAIFPYVFRVPEWGPLVPQTGEVAGIHLIDGARLLAGEGRGEFHYVGYGYDLMLPCVRIDGTFIWGLTLRMVDQLAERLRA